MRVYDVPLVPAVLGLVLGPLSEQQFRRALAISEGDLLGVRHATDLRHAAGAGGRSFFSVPALLRRWTVPDARPAV